MSKTVIISDKSAQILEQLVSVGQFDDVNQAVDDLIQRTAEEEFDSEFLESIREALVEVESGLAVPMTRALFDQIVIDARSQASKSPE